MAAPGDVVLPQHLVDDAPSEAASWTQRIKNKTHNVVALLEKLKASKAVRTNFRAMVDLKLKKVIIACVLCWTTVSCSNMTTGQYQHIDRCCKRAADAVPTPTISAKRLSPKQQRRTDRFFALFVATSGVPYAMCKNKWLKRALDEAGADTLSPKRLKTTLDTLYEETRLEKDAELKEELQLFKNRAAKHYQPVMAAARLLDPINFKYLNHVDQPYPDFDILTEMQRVELEPTIARLAEVPIGLVRAELSKFENTEWNPAMKRKALSMLSIQQPPGRAVTPIASIIARKAFWSMTAAKDFPVLAKAVLKLLSVHVSTVAAERNWSMWSLTYSNALRSRLGVETAKRDIYLKANVEEMDEERDNMAPPQETLINILA